MSVQYGLSLQSGNPITLESLEYLLGGTIAGLIGGVVWNQGPKVGNTIKGYMNKLDLLEEQKYSINFMIEESELITNPLVIGMELASEYSKYK